MQVRRLPLAWLTQSHTSPHGESSFLSLPQFTRESRPLKTNKGPSRIAARMSTFDGGPGSSEVARISAAESHAANGQSFGDRLPAGATTDPWGQSPQNGS